MIFFQAADLEVALAAWAGLGAHRVVLATLQMVITQVAVIAALAALGADPVPLAVAQGAVEVTQAGILEAGADDAGYWRRPAHRTEGLIRGRGDPLGLEMGGQPGPVDLQGSADEGGGGEIEAGEVVIEDEAGLGLDPVLGTCPGEARQGGLGGGGNGWRLADLGHQPGQGLAPGRAQGPARRGQGRHAVLLAALQEGEIGQRDVRIGIEQGLLGLRQLRGEGEKIAQAMTLGQLAQAPGALAEEAAGGQA